MGTALETILGIIGALLLLTAIVVAHEYGHYKVGRIFNFKIMEFAVGLGPKLFKRIKNGIIYSVRALPVGGFTKFYGEDEVLEDKDAFNKQPIGRRALVIVAGPVMNIILAWLLAVVFLCAFGDMAPYINNVTQGSPAEAVGLQHGDRLIAVNGNKIELYAEMGDILIDGFSKPPDITVERNGKQITFQDVNTIYSAESKKNIIGVTFTFKKQTFGIFEAIGLSFKWLFVTLKQMLVSIFNLIFHGKGAESAMGVVGIINVVGVAVHTSLDLVIQLGALISLNLAIVNLLPFPALDGGRLVLLAIEKVRKKPLPMNIEGYMNFAGFVALMVLMVILTYQDIARLISG